MWLLILAVGLLQSWHYNNVIMSAIASQIISLTIVYSTVYSDADQRKHQSSASLAFVRGIHRGPVNSPHKWPVTRKMFPSDDVIMVYSEIGWKIRIECLFNLTLWVVLPSTLEFCSWDMCCNCCNVNSFLEQLPFALVDLHSSREIAKTRCLYKNRLLCANERY